MLISFVRISFGQCKGLVRVEIASQGYKEYLIYYCARCIVDDAQTDGERKKTHTQSPGPRK